MGRKYEIIERDSGRKIEIINDAIFKKKKYIGWKEVKEYLKKYVGEYYTILLVDEKVYIGSDFPNEFTGSIYTYSLKGANVKAKANAAQVIPQMIEIASGGNYRENNEDKQCFMHLC